MLYATFVTTLDNPFDYFTQFDDWYAYDTQMGYNTCSYVARIAKTTSAMSERDEILATNQAVDEILRLNLTGNYKKVVEKEPFDDSDDDFDDQDREFDKDEIDLLFDDEDDDDKDDEADEDEEDNVDSGMKKEKES